MKKTLAITLSLITGIVLLLTLTGFFKDTSGSQSSAPESLPANIYAGLSVAEQSPSLTTEEKIGQMMMVSIPGTSLSEETAVWLKSHHIGGVILLGGNVSSREQVKQLINDLEFRVAETTTGPLFVAVDQEGGLVSRFRFLKELTPQSAIFDQDTAFRVAFERGRELRELGVNVNFAPVLDVSSTTKDFITSRAFKGDADHVALLGSAMIDGYRQAGIIPVAKHFPGHGGTVTDSHRSLPVLPVGREEYLHSLEPFREASDNNVAMMMIGHLQIPAVDTLPASLSPVIVAETLRRNIGYDGVVITDDMAMGALRDVLPLPEANVQAVRAGVDMLLVVRGIAEYDKIYSALARAVQSGEISEERLDQSVARIMRLKQSLGRQSGL